MDDKDGEREKEREREREREREKESRKFMMMIYIVSALKIVPKGLERKLEFKGSIETIETTAL